MILTLNPIRSDSDLVLSRAGDCLILNGVPHDFSAIPEGGCLDAAKIGSPWILSEVRREAGRLHLDILLPHGPLPYPPPPEAAVVTHPVPLLVEEDGPVALPCYAPKAAEDPMQEAP